MKNNSRMKKVRLCLIALLAAAPAALAAEDPCRAGVKARDRKDYQAAVDKLNACLAGEVASEQGRVQLLQVRAQAYQGLNHLAFAVEDQQEAINLDKSRSAWPWITMGIYRRELKQYDKALAALEEAEKRDEDGPGTGPGMAVYYHTGWTLHEAGRYADAVKAYTKGLPRQLDYRYAYYRRGLAYEALGERDKAKKDFSRVAKLSRKAGVKEDIARKLREYGLDAPIAVVPQ